MQHLAEWTRNHESQQYAYDQVWDGNKIYGCLCDLGYSGYDCSIRDCPRGDDPLTIDNTLQEIQLLRCSASGSSGHMVLYFDGIPSSPIPADASTNALKTALETISIIDEVAVTYLEGHTLCRNDVINIVSITFLQNFGPLPPLVAETFDMESWSVVEVASDNTNGMMTDHNGINHFAVKGNKENDECSNRGIVSP